MVDTGKILITGPTGNVGSAVLNILASTYANLRALVHDEPKAQSLRDRSVEAVLGDLLDPESLAPALEGVGTVLLITTMSSIRVKPRSSLSTS